MKTNSSGFTLIEVMIAAAVVAILAAIAYPSYQDSMRKSRRADAKAVMLETAQLMERLYTTNSCYDAPPCGSGNLPALPGALPGNVFTVPRNEAVAANRYYAITWAIRMGGAPARGIGFTITATPQNAQVHDKCAILTLDETNVRTADGKPATDPLTKECWGR